MSDASSEASSAARLFSRRQRLSLGADWRSVAQAARDYAEIRRARLPAGVDGLAYRFGGRTVLFVGSGLTERRALFTLAHELGHLLLGWHLGGVRTCNPPDGSEPPPALLDIQRAEEREADAFAAELLIPSGECREILERTPGASGIQQVFARSAASPIATARRLISVLEPGWAYIQLDNRRTVQYTGRSPGTDPHLPDHGHPWTPQLATGAIEVFHVTAPSLANWGGQMYWLRYPSRSPLQVRSTRTSAELLDEIFDGLHLEEEERRHRRAQLAGVLGYANSVATRGGASPEKLHGYAWQRLDGRPLLTAVISHPLFGTYLSQWILEQTDRAHLKGARGAR